MQIKEKHNVIIEKHPLYKSLNQKLNQDFLDADFLENTVSVSGKHSAYNTSSETIDKIFSWVITLIKQQGVEYISYCEHYYKQSWFVEYGMGDVSHPHVHIPRTFSFVYFVKCPKGSSPLVFTTTGKKVKAEEGKVVIFPANLYHHVPPNRCKERLALAGNIDCVEKYRATP
tara:strand:- start:115 stop:630 length:516 start_codon:yes stop_codon:yes gene_type:complete